jgi:hypothetical protein
VDESGETEREGASQKVVVMGNLVEE